MGQGRFFFLVVCVCVLLGWELALETLQLNCLNSRIGQVASSPNSTVKPTKTSTSASCGTNCDDEQESELCRFRDLRWVASQNKSSPLYGKFRPDVESFRCIVHQQEPFAGQLQFDLLECPPAYHQSTFELEAMTGPVETNGEITRDNSGGVGSRMAGRVKARTSVQNGCAVYQAMAPLTAASKDTTSSTFINLYWTSQRRWYSNRVSDIADARALLKLKQEGKLTEEEVVERLGADRIDFLTRHQDPLGRISLQIFEEDNKTMDAQTPRSQLPYCHELALSEWGTAGIFEDQKGGSLYWPMGCAGCNFHAFSREELNAMLRGIRVKHLMDSHGELLRRNFWGPKLCPNVSSPDLFAVHNDDCPDHSNDWMITWRFFRAVYNDETFELDYDGLSKNLRAGKPEACHDFLGLGKYNVTVVGIPMWLFVYETNEGLDNFILSLESLFKTCKHNFPTEFERHVFLVHTSMAVDSFAIHFDSNSWRGIQNHRIEPFQDEVTQRLGPLVDGVLPFYDLTYARLHLILGETTTDGVHFGQQVYEELFGVIMAGIMSALKTHGLDSKLAEQEVPRWWTNVSL